VAVADVVTVGVAAVVTDGVPVTVGVGLVDEVAGVDTGNIF
jgi:hypothetical protein